MSKMSVSSYEPASQGRNQARFESRKRVLLDELKVCIRTKNLQRGEKLHAEAVEIGSDSCVYFATTLIKMYAKCGSMTRARQVFEEINYPDVVVWTVLIMGYAENGKGFTALALFQRMKSQGYAPNSVTFIAALKACTSVALERSVNGKVEGLKLGRQLHAQINCHSDMHLQNTLINMYARCGSMSDAHQVFSSMEHPSVVSWTALILGYAEVGEGNTALELFAEMKSQGCAPDSLTFVAALKACSCLEQARDIHSQIGGVHCNLYVQSTLVDVYASCGSMRDAQGVFDCIKNPNVVTWTSLILGYAENGEGATALNLFIRMRRQGCVPNSFSFVAALKACGLSGALEYGSKLHTEIQEYNVIVVTSLVDFYAKSGNLVEAQRVFDSHPEERDLKTWTALLAGYSRLGHCKAVFRLFEGMQDAGFQPNGVTFLCILMCCSHAGLVAKANEFFEAMSSRYGISPTVEHYNCMLDMLGRSNKLDGALEFLQSMPCRPDSASWMTVLASARKWKNVEIGRMAFQRLVILDSTNAAAYVLMAEIYGSRGMRLEQGTVLASALRKDCKEPAETCWTNSHGEAHVFSVERVGSERAEGYNIKG